MIYPSGKVPLKLLIIVVLLNALMTTLSSLRAEEDFQAMNGIWYINEVLSDDTDIQVEKAIKASGGKVKRSMRKKGKGRYKGGPPEQALYDHISYDETLYFDYQAPEFRLRYGEGFERIFHSDGRGRSATASGGDRSKRRDYAFASWSGAEKLFVEARPRDGGRTNEVYSLFKTETGEQMLRVELKVDPLMFSGPIFIKRVYQRHKPEPVK